MVRSDIINIYNNILGPRNCRYKTLYRVNDGTLLKFYYEGDNYLIILTKDGVRYLGRE